MTEIHGVPAHVLLVHFAVVLLPLTALLVIVCALWSAAYRHVVWLTLILAAVTAVLMPITVNTGEQLFNLKRNPGPMLREHADRGVSMTYFSIALLVVAIAIAVLRIFERRANKRRLTINAVIAIFALAVGISSTIQVYRVGEDGAQAVWDGEIPRLKKANGT